MVAADTFGRDGVEISLDEIARRAGVGPGTVHRHFPTKAALLDATIVDSVARLAAEARALRRAADPVAAFCEFFITLVTRGAASHALAHRLAHAGVDVDRVVTEPVRELREALAALLRRAQRTGGLRREIDARALDAIIAGAHAILVHPHGGPHLVALLCDALRAR
jgi:AcrR family transcriptional regulator